MCDLSRGGEPVEFPGLDGFLAKIGRDVVEDDSGVGSRLDNVEPFVFCAVPVWDGRGIMWGNGYEVDTSLSEAAGIAEVDLVPVYGAIQRMRECLSNEGRISSLDPVRFVAHRGPR